MITNDRQEPPVLDADEAGIADFRPEADWKADARRGSAKLLKALLRSNIRRAPRPKRQYARYGSWQDRQLAHQQVERLQRAVADYFGISPDLFTGRRGPQQLSAQRHVAMYLAREVIQASFPDIAKCFGRSNHTTVIHACRAVETNPELASHAAALRTRLAV